jgi:hypothetical protein
LKLFYSFFYLTILSLVIISCECADEIDTDREHIPSEFAQISVTNLSTEPIELKYNNIIMSEYDTRLNLNPYNKIESGRPVLSLSISGQGENLYSIPLSLEEGKYYSAIIFNDLRYRVLVFQDDYDLISREDFLLRLINLSPDEAEYNFSSASGTFSRFESEEIIANSTDNLNLNNEQINLSGLSSGRVYSIIIESDGNFFVGQSISLN